MIRYGIVGIGGFAATWVRSLRSLEEKGVARLAAAVVRHPGKYAREVTELTARSCAIYATLEEMLARGQGHLDIVGVPTGIPYHAPMAVQAMEAGYNVLIEKPVAATIQEVLQLQETEQRTGRWCAVGYQWIYSPTTQWLKKKIAHGQVGAIYEARTMIGWPRATSYYERNAWAGQLRDKDHWILDGPATNATAHYLTNILYLVGAQPNGPTAISAVRAELYRAKPIPSYDTSCVLVSMSDGTRVLHTASHSLAETLDPVMEIICEKANIHWEARSDTVVIDYEDGDRERYANPDPSRNHQRLFEQVARVATGQELAPLCGLAEGGPHVLAINLAFESSRGVVSIPERYTYARQNSDGPEIICVEGMEEMLKEAQATGCIFSELGPPWAKATEGILAKDYTRFPRNEALLGQGRHK